MTKRLAIDPNNPPAKIVYVRDGVTYTSGNGFTLKDERSFCDYMRKNSVFEASDGFRPVCIVRLKAYRT